MQFETFVGAKLMLLQETMQKHFSGKTHDIIAVLLAPIDDNQVDYDQFIKSYNKEAQNLKNKKIVCVTINKMNYTAFNNLYSNWFQRNGWKNYPDPEILEWNFFVPNSFWDLKITLKQELYRYFIILLKQDLT